MNKYRNELSGGGKFSFLTAALLLAVLVTALNVSIFAQSAMEAVDARILEGARTDSSEKETVSDESLQNPDAPDVISAATYVFSPTNAVLEDMSSGTVQIVAPGLDDTASAVTNIGFDFWYDGVRYTQFSCNANGLCRLGAAAVATTFTNSLGSTTDAPKIATYFDDLSIGTNGKIHYKVTGSAPNRKLIVEFLNMNIPRAGGSGTFVAAPGAATFQLWLFESAATANPGVIEFVYGSGIVVNSANSGYSIGLQSGAAANFASVTSSTGTVDYTTANNTQTNAITAGTAYLFTPNVPTAPTGLTFTATNAASTTLNWTDNSANEFGFVIYRSTDGGTTYNFLAQTAANATSYTDTGLSPTTTYFYRVYAVTEGALSSPPLAGSLTTPVVGNDTCNGAGGLWSVPGTWADGSVPNAGDNVTISAGCTVTIDIASNALSLVVQNTGVLQYESATARTLTVGTFVTIDNGGTFQSAPIVNITGHVLNVGTDLTNNGTLDFSTNANAAGAGIVFTGAANNTFGGTGATTDIRTITVNKGTSNANILELNTTNLTVQGVTTDAAGFLTLTNGTFKLSGTFTVTNRVFTTAAYTIGATTTFWLNNPNFTVAGQNGSPTNSGLLRLTQGTYNVGTMIGNSLGASAGAVFTVEGGTMNVTGRLQTTSAITYTQSAGTVNVCTVGQTAATACFGLTGTSTLNMTGGTIVLVQRSTNATPLDYQVTSAPVGTVGTTLQVGSAATATNFNFNIRGNIPNLAIDNTTNNKTATAVAQITLNGTTLIRPGTTLTINGQICLVLGPTFTNNGTLTGTAAGTRFYFLTTYGATTYTGTGVVTAPLTAFEVDNVAGVTIDPATTNQIVTARFNNFSGGLTNSNKLTIGNGGATTAVTQLGVTGVTQPVNGFDVPPVYNPGTGGVILIYAPELTGRTTGNEMPPSRTLTTLNMSNTNPLTIAGGDVTVNGAGAGAIALSGGRIITGANTLFFNSAAGTVTRTTGYVDGNFNKTYTAIGSKLFEVGTANGYSPATANVTALGTNPSSLTVAAVNAVLPGLSPTSSAARYWTVNEFGDLTADLSFTYLDADISGDETTYKVYRREAGVTTVYPGGNTNNPATNTATVTGVTNFSDWGIGAAPTASAVTIGGRVRDANNRAIANAVVTMTDASGAARTARTNPLGFYRFDDVDAGQTYMFVVSAKRYRFNTQLFNVLEDSTELNFYAQP